MRLRDHPGVTQVWVGARLSLPDPDPRCILSVETTIPFLKKQDGYDQTQVEELLEAVRKEMDKAGAEIAEIFSATNSGVFLTTEADPA
jgi:hypothetical protein